MAWIVTTTVWVEKWWGEHENIRFCVCTREHWRGTQELPPGTGVRRAVDGTEVAVRGFSAWFSCSWYLLDF